MLASQLVISPVIYDLGQYYQVSRHSHTELWDAAASRSSYTAARQHLWKFNRCGNIKHDSTHRWIPFDSERRCMTALFVFHSDPLGPFEMTVNSKRLLDKINAPPGWTSPCLIQYRLRQNGIVRIHPDYHSPRLPCRSYLVYPPENQVNCSALKPLLLYLKGFSLTITTGPVIASATTMRRQKHIFMVEKLSLLRVLYGVYDSWLKVQQLHKSFRSALVHCSTNVPKHEERSADRRPDKKRHPFDRSSSPQEEHHL